MEQDNDTSPATLYDAARELRGLATQYRSDCQSRIELLTEECLSVFDTLEHEDARDYREQLGHWNATIEMIDRVADRCDPILLDREHSPALPHGTELDELFAKDGRIALVWSIDDVLDVRSDLTKQQAWEVLELVGYRHDTMVGVTWEVLEEFAEDLFPIEESGG